MEIVTGILEDKDMKELDIPKSALKVTGTQVSFQVVCEDCGEKKKTVIVPIEEDELKIMGDLGTYKVHDAKGNTGSVLGILLGDEAVEMLGGLGWAMVDDEDGQKPLLRCPACFAESFPF